MLSIIIITKNEEHYLPKLLKSIKKQDFKDYEIIVADANSKDKTRQIARKFGCEVVKGGLPTVGRNNATRYAKGDILLFLDSDTILPKHFLKENVAEFIKKDLGIATCFQIPISDNIIDKIYFKVSDFLLVLGSFIYPCAYGFCIFTKKEVFNKIGGFDTEVKMWDDHEYAKRASKVSKYGIIKKVKIRVSVRRLIKFGRFRTIVKSIVSGLYRVFFGEIKDNRFDYKLNYKKIRDYNV